VDTREVLIAVLEAANRRDLDAAAPFVDPAFVGEVPSDVSAEPDVYEGHDGIQRYFESFWEIVDDLTLECDAFDHVGTWTLASVHARSVGRGSGLPVDGHIALSVQSRNDRLIRLRAHPDLNEARAWAGGNEQRAEPKKERDGATGST
jgi:ketosteroid isomerase-like protein